MSLPSAAVSEGGQPLRSHVCLVVSVARLGECGADGLLIEWVGRNEPEETSNTKSPCFPFDGLEFLGRCGSLGRRFVCNRSCPGEPSQAACLCFRPSAGAEDGMTINASFRSVQVRPTSQRWRRERAWILLKPCSRRGTGATAYEAEWAPGRGPPRRDVRDSVAGAARPARLEGVDGRVHSGEDVAGVAEEALALS